MMLANMLFNRPCLSKHRALCRFELLEALIRLADAKYRKPKIAPCMSDAVRMLCELNIKPVLEPLARFVDSNVFREEQLYQYVAWHATTLHCALTQCSNTCMILSGDVNEVFLKNYAVLKGLHGYYCQFKHGSRQPLMSLKEWDKMLKDADMYDEVRTKRAQLPFIRSKCE